MPLNFPEVWKKRYEFTITQADKAPWLDGIEEIDAEILEVNPNDISEQNIIYLPSTEFEVDVLINNTTYPLQVQQFEDGRIAISLDKYQTKVVTLSDDQIIGAAPDKMDAAQRMMSRAMLIKKYGKAIHSLAPASHNAAKTPILVTTGRSGKYNAAGEEIIWKDENGVLFLTYADLVDHKAQYDAIGVDLEDRRLVLSTTHYNQLLKDRERYGDNFSNYREGTLAPVIASFQIYQYINNPYFTVATKTKKAYGSVPGVGDSQASVSFFVPNAAKKTGLTKQYFKRAADDPDNQTNRLAYRHYYVVTNKLDRYYGAILSGTFVEA